MHIHFCAQGYCLLPVIIMEFPVNDYHYGKKMVGVIFSNGKRNLCVDSLSFVDALPEVVYYVMSQTAECQIQLYSLRFQLRCGCPAILW